MDMLLYNQSPILQIKEEIVKSDETLMVSNFSQRGRTWNKIADLKTLHLEHDYMKHTTSEMFEAIQRQTELNSNSNFLVQCRGSRRKSLVCEKCGEKFLLHRSLEIHMQRCDYDDPRIHESHERIYAVEIDSDDDDDDSYHPPGETKRLDDLEEKKDDHGDEDHLHCEVEHHGDPESCGTHGNDDDAVVVNNHDDDDDDVDHSVDDTELLDDLDSHGACKEKGGDKVVAIDYGESDHQSHDNDGKSSHVDVVIHYDDDYASDESEDLESQEAHEENDDKVVVIDYDDEIQSCAPERIDGDSAILTLDPDKFMPETDIKLFKYGSTCLICKKVISGGPNKMDKHMRVHTGEKPYACCVCGKRFSQSYTPLKHMLTHVSDEPKDSFSQCQFCGKYYPSACMRIHIKLHHPFETKSCGICKKTFVWKEDLENHMVLHTGEKRFSCCKCGRKFFHQCALKKHMVYHGSREKICSVCGKGYYRNTDLKSHLKTHFKKKKVKCLLPKYFCFICKKRFHDVDEKNKHLRTMHSFTRPYPCQVCCKKFSSLKRFFSHWNGHNSKSLVVQH